MKSSINHVYESHQEVLIIGLTGKLGSGCSTVAKILTQNINKWELPHPGDDCIATNKQREYRMLYNYAFMHKGYKSIEAEPNDDYHTHLKPFRCIKMRDVFVSILLSKADEEDDLQTVLNEIIRFVLCSTGSKKEYSADAVKGFEENLYDRVKAQLKDSLAHYAQKDVINKAYREFKTYIDLRKNSWYLHKGGYQEAKESRDFIDDETIKDIYIFIYDVLPAITMVLRHFIVTELDVENSTGLYTRGFQELGNVIRMYDEPLIYIKLYNEIQQDNKEDNIKNMVLDELHDNSYSCKAFSSTSEHIHEFIKLLKDYLYLTNKDNTKDETDDIRLDKDEDTRRFVVIDSFKNPFEFEFLKNKYSDFYMIAINKEENRRIKRVTKDKKIDYKSFEKVDNIERLEKTVKDDLRNSKNKYNYEFTHQDVMTCIQKSDIFIDNVDTEGTNFIELKKQLLRYLVLMTAPGILVPTKIEKCMQIAVSAKVNSGCISRQVGAVITDENFRIKSIGFNDVPEGCTPCNVRDLELLYHEHDKLAFSHYEQSNGFLEKLKDTYTQDKIDEIISSLRGHPFSFCFNDLYVEVADKDKEEVNTRALHAEERAFLEIMKNGIGSVEGGNLFTTSSPCVLCSKKAYHLGIKHIYYIEPYKGLSDKHILRSGNGARPQLHLFNGAVGEAYMKLYTPIMPYKDEKKLRYNSQSAKKNN